MEDDLEKLEAIFGKVNIVNSQYEVKVSAKIYPHMIRIFVPKNSYMKRIPYMEPRVDDLDYLVEDYGTRINTSENNEEDNHERSLRRTKTLISDYALCNEFDLFATFTINPAKTSDRYNPDVVKLQMANWLRNQRKRYGKFQYLIVPEFHKDGKALHFHALFKNYKGKLIDVGFDSKHRKLFHFKSYTLGFNSAIPIDDITKVSSYIKKYITKDMPEFRNKRRFWTSLDLKRPLVVDNPKGLPLGELMRTYEGRYGVTFDFDWKESEEEVDA